MSWALLYRDLVFLLLVTGTVLLIWHRVLTPRVFWSRVQYFTIVSNILSFGYLTALAAGADWPFLYTPSCRFYIAASMLTTCIMYHFMVAPGAIKTHRLNDVEFEHYSAYNFLLHYIVPILLTADWIFFTDKDGAPWTLVITWMVIPAAYTVFIYIRAWLTIALHGRSNLYPYTFLDPRLHPWPQVIRNILIVGAIFFAIGLVTYGAGMIVPKALLS